MQKKKIPKAGSQTTFLFPLICFYSLLLLSACILACFFSYKQKQSEVMSQIHATSTMMEKEYENIVDNFWQIYMPIYEYTTDTYEIWSKYFNDDLDDLSGTDKLALETSLRQMMQRDNNIQWIALFNQDRTDNYILFNGSYSLRLLPEDFPYLSQLASNKQSMQLYGRKIVPAPNSTLETFAISGNVPSILGNGQILVGYSLSAFQLLCQSHINDSIDVNYVLTNNDDIIFDYSRQYDSSVTYYSTTVLSDETVKFNGEKLLVTSNTCARNSSKLTYYMSKDELYTYYHQNTPLLLFMFLIFAISSFILTLILKYNMDKAYYYELKQKETEISDLQSKFNPHFLYNSLELLRSRCQLNGDETTADLITQLSAIFRGFINARIFIPITEELTFSKRYLTLFGANYKDQVEIRYDFEKDILQYGIIRNVFQPLIENYFVHGFDTNNEENYIIFRGKSLDEHTMVLSMEDNGTGMSKEEIETLIARLHEPVKNSNESYGLKNLHQRLQLFYGKEYGLSITPNPTSAKGISIQMIVPKITCKEYEENRNNRLSDR